MYLKPLLFGILVALAGPGFAQTDLLFATPHLSDSAVGSSLHYDKRREIAEGVAPELEDESERLELALGPSETAGRRSVEAFVERDGQRQQLTTFDNMSGNPVLMIFLEEVTRTVSDATGGSPFYLRNRMREGLSALVAEPVGSATLVTMRPFAEDVHRDRMGAFAALEVEFLFDAAAPGMIRRMTARAGSSYLEEVLLDETP